MGGRLTRGVGVAAVLAATAVAAAVAAWALLAGLPPWHPHASPPSPAAFAWAVLMWQAMMVAMMTPTVAPWVVAFGRLAGDDAGRGRLGASAAFAAGYVAVWFGYSVVAAALQFALSAAGLIGHGGAPPLVAAAVLIAAGAFQFAPMKQACLTHCRNPISYLLAQWRGGPPSGFRLGLVHGAYCVGCCWLLMLTGFAVGVMNLAWMAILTVAVAAEQVAPGGPWVGRGMGLALVAWGVVLAWPG